MLAVVAAGDRTRPRHLCYSFYFKYGKNWWRLQSELIVTCYAVVRILQIS